MATYANIYVDQGADYETVVAAVRDNGDPLDLTDLDITAQVRRTYQSETAYDFTVFKQDAFNGEIKLTLDSATSATMPRGRYVYDVYAESSVSGIRFKILYGILEIIPMVTRP